MQYKKLGRTGLYVSRLCLGTMNFGDCTDKKSAFEIMDRAADLGINFIDTADGNEALSAHDSGPERPPLVGLPYSPGLRGQFATSEDRPY